MVLLPNDLARYGVHLIGAAFSLANIILLQDSGYFMPAAEALPLLHTWSLAVEEQFYLVFPLLMLLLWRFGCLRTVGLVLSILAGGSFMGSIWTLGIYPSAAFYMPHTRVWELLLGAILALEILPPAKRARVRDFARMVGCLLYTSPSPRDRG